MDVDEYCRQVEAHLCRKNDGHLIRIVGPSFDLVSGWAAAGIPVRIVWGGIDRYFERYYAKGPRRRPVRIDFCEADILDLFDRWRRAVGVKAQPAVTGEGTGGDCASSRPPDADLDRLPSRLQASLPAHLERLVARLTTLRAGGTLPRSLDEAVERAVREIDAARAGAKGARGEARSALLSRLEAIDGELLDAALAASTSGDLQAFAREAAEELAPFRPRMAAEAFAGATREATRRIVRDRFGLPVIGFAG